MIAQLTVLAILRVCSLSESAVPQQDKLKWAKALIEYIQEMND